MDMNQNSRYSRSLDYVHYTKVDNSASVASSSSLLTSNSDDVITKEKLQPDMVTSVLEVKPKLAFKTKIIVVLLTLFFVLGFAGLITVAISVIDSLSKQGNTDKNISFNGTLEETSISPAIITGSTAVSQNYTSIGKPWFLTTTTTAETVATTSIPRTVCNSSEFACSSQECVSVELLCNGVPDCSDGSDERRQCECSSDEFQCPSGQCVPKSAVCDETYDCLDKGDEANCPDCAGFRCVSNNVCLWDRMTRKCNNVFDCDDYSDEMGCKNKPGQYLCSNGVHILSVDVCDGLDDCGDNSDEENCVCKESRQFPCSGKRGKCIPSTWLCDGHPDCPNGTDEDSCGVCTDQSFRCADYSCINKTLHCDGKVDCPFPGGDEDGCVEVTSSDELHVSLEGDMVPVCSSHWADEYSRWACSLTTSRVLVTWSSQPASTLSTMFAVIKDRRLPAGLSNFYLSDACPTATIVHVRCQDAGCGRRRTEVLVPFIAGGGVAPLGKWPWVTSLAYLDKPICGSVLINSRWVLTAAHCVMHPVDISTDHSKMAFHYTVTAGGVQLLQNRTGDSSQPQPQLVRVSKVVLHPQTHVLDNGGLEWDLALLRLDEPVGMTRSVQPICLPAQDQVFPATSICYIAGWGLLSYRQYIRSNLLRDTRMQLWTESRCSSNTVLGEKTVDTRSTLCAGYLFGRPTGCQGDSGGPLMCQDPSSGHFLLAGIVSRGSSLCGQSRPYTHGNRFARVASAVTWIQEVTASSFS